LKGPADAIKESCTHINIQQKNPNFQTSNPTPTQLGKWTIFIPRTTTFTYIHKVHTRILLGFLEKHTNTSKETFALSTYKKQVAVKKKNLIVYVVYNANFLSCCNGYIIQKITNILEILNEHAHTQVEMCG
jgi:cobalamin-dependent methionine synthase I